MDLSTRGLERGSFYFIFLIVSLEGPPFKYPPDRARCKPHSRKVLRGRPWWIYPQLGNLSIYIIHEQNTKVKYRQLTIDY